MGLTIKDVAKKAGVSIATVSRVINNKGLVIPETERKVLSAIDELHKADRHAGVGSVRVLFCGYSPNSGAGADEVRLPDYSRQHL